MMCASHPGPPSRDACFGDSGGPLVGLPSGGTAPTDYMLVGLVESGIGCADDFPGIYDNVRDTDVQGFITSQPPQAPQQGSPTQIGGTPASGKAVTCQPGSWSGSPSFLYEFIQDPGSGQNLKLLSGPSPEGVYKVQPSDVGAQIFCIAKASNDGGYGFGVSNTVTGQTPVVTSTVPDSKRPTSAISRKTCGRTRCVVNLQVADPLPSSGIAKVTVTMRWRAVVSCPRGSHSRHRCTKTKTKTLRAHSIGGGHFVVTATRLKPQNYTLIFTAVDKAGNKQRRPTYTTLRVKRRR